MQSYGSVTVMNRSIHPNEDHSFYNHCHHHLHNILIDSSKANKLNKLPLPASSLSWSIITTINFNIITIIAIITIITTTVSSSPIKTLKKPPPCWAKVWEEGSCHEEDSCAENGVIWQLHHLHHHHHQCNEFNQAHWEQTSQFCILPNSVVWNSYTI